MTILDRLGNCAVMRGDVGDSERDSRPFAAAIGLDWKQKWKNPAGRRGHKTSDSLHADITAKENCVQTLRRASSLRAKQDRAQRKALWVWDWFSMSELLSWANLESLLCRWCVAFRSFRAHIRIQSSRAKARVDLGPALQFRDGRYQPNTRTTARDEGIRRLQASHLWTDCVDLQIFLMGFDAGEEYGKDTLRLEHRNQEPLNTALKTHLPSQ